MNLGGWAIGEKLYKWIVDHIPSSYKILELGSGTGSSKLGETYDITCVEHDKKWVDKYDNINYVYAPIVDGWYDRKVIDTLPNDHFLLLIDGPPGRIGRSGVLDYVEQLASNKIVIVDDVHRDAEAALLLNLWTELGGESKVKMIEDGTKRFGVIYYGTLS